MKKKVIRRAGSIALSTALVVTMLPQGSLAFANELQDTEVVSGASGVNAGGTYYDTSSDASGLNYTLAYKEGTPSGKYNAQYSGSTDSQQKYDGNDLGCTYTKTATTFKVWSPSASKVVLCRYSTGSDSESGAGKISETEMTKDSATNVWSVTIKEDCKDTYYTYKVTNNGNTSEVVDIYAKAVGVNGKRAMVVDLDSTDPANWDTNYTRTATRLSDSIIWEVNVCDFSIDSSSGMKNRGKYLAFAEDGTKISGTDYTTGIEYLKKMGITHVQIMPMYDYGSVDESTATSDTNYNWGYDPVNFNAPEGSYSTNPYDGNVRINEMKQMIQALHDAGIKVVMDVVYNHTYCKDGQEMAYFDDIVPNYYYRTDSNGKQTNGSGCGNEVRTESYMGNKFIRESLLYWASEYNLDGFRFDLMGLYDVRTMKDIRNDMDAAFGEGTILLYGEGWNGMFGGQHNDDSAYKDHSGELANYNIGYFNDQIRDAVHGESDKDSQIGLVQQGWADGKSTDPEKYPTNVFAGIQGSAGKNTSSYWYWRGYWADHSDMCVSYDSCHDNTTLWDKLCKTTGFANNYNSTDSKLLSMNRMTAAYILTSHGGSFLHAGEEFARTKNGVHNSYSGSAENGCNGKGISTNKLDWSRVGTYTDLVDYYKGMIEVRKAFSGFRTTYTSASSGPENEADGKFRNVGNNNMTNIDSFTSCSNYTVKSIGYYLSNDVSGEWNQLAVLINNQTTDKSVTLSAKDGSSSWVLVSDGTKASVNGVQTVEGNNITVPAKSVVVAVPKKTFDANPYSASNSAPVMTIDTDSTIETAPESKVTIKVTAKDADGDKVTLSATGMPEGAEFDAANGTFIWNSAVKGNYTVTFTASDGTNKTTKSVTIKVTSPSAALEELVAEIEAANLVEAEYTQKVWSALQNALAAAKAVIAESNPSEAACTEAKNTLQNAYDDVKAEKDAKDALTEYVATAKKSISDAGEDANDAALLADVKAVLADAEALTKEVVSAQTYKIAQDNLTDSVNSLAIGSGSPSIHASAPGFSTPHVYAWVGEGDAKKEFFGQWPGVALTEKDADGNYVIDIDTTEAFNVIINNGGSGKTDDLTGVSGKVSITVGTNLTTNSKGETVYESTKKCEAVSQQAPEIFKTSLNAVLEAAKKCDEKYYTAESFASLKKEITAAEDVSADSKATQLVINKQTRALRAAILALESNGEVVPTPMVTPTATPTEEPENTATPTPSASPSASDTDASSTPEATATAQVSPTGPATIGPDQSAAPSSAPVETAQPTTIPQPTGTPSVTSVPTDMKISSVKFSPSLCQVVKKTVKVSAKASNAVGSVKFRFVVKKGSQTVAEQAYGSKTTFSFKPTKTGTYTVVIYAKDEDGAEVSTTKKFSVVSKKLAVSLKIKKSKNVKNKTMTTKITTAASGGKKSYKYKYVVKDAKGKTVKTISYSSKKTWSWKVKKKGTYIIEVTVKDATGTTVKKKYKVIKK